MERVSLQVCLMPTAKSALPHVGSMKKHLHPYEVLRTQVRRSFLRTANGSVFLPTESSERYRHRAARQSRCATPSRLRPEVGGMMGTSSPRSTVAGDASHELHRLLQRQRQ